MQLQELLQLTLSHQASDLHISADLPPMLRIDGELNKLEHPIIDNNTAQKLLYGTLDETQQAFFQQHKEIDFALDLPDIGRFRVNVYQQQRGLSGAFRVIPQTIPQLSDLGLPDVLQEIAALSQGLVLITGATGSGKSSTLASMVNYINQHQAKHIITIEDPVEFIYASKKSLINQRQVQRDTLTFHNALRAALREDPDIILVGELRDLETIRLALTAAETGHLVLATLHTASAAKTINRIIDVFPGSEQKLVRTLLAESLQAVICQKLVKRIERGRIAALEIMLATAAIRNLIREDKIPQIHSTIQTSKHLGMQTLDQHLQRLVETNFISKENAHKSALNKELFG